MSDVNVQAGEETAALVRAAGGDAIFVAADVGKPEDCEALVQRTVAHYGRLDVACNNAGIGGPQAPTADYPLDGWAQVININLSGVFYGMKYQIAAMLKNGGGAIINMASILGSVGFATAPAYTAAKHGVVGLTKAAAIEYSAHGVRINAVAPGIMETPASARIIANDSAREAAARQYPLPGIGDPAELAGLMAWLLSPAAARVTGQVWSMDGGFASIRPLVK